MVKSAKKFTVPSLAEVLSGSGVEMLAECPTVLQLRAVMRSLFPAHLDRIAEAHLKSDLMELVKSLVTEQNKGASVAEELEGPLCPEDPKHTEGVEDIEGLKGQDAQDEEDKMEDDAPSAAPPVHVSPNEEALEEAPEKTTEAPESDVDLIVVEEVPEAMQRKFEARLAMRRQILRGCCAHRNVFEDDRMMVFEAVSGQVFEGTVGTIATMALAGILRPDTDNLDKLSIQCLRVCHWLGAVGTDPYSVPKMWREAHRVEAQRQLVTQWNAAEERFRDQERSLEQVPASGQHSKTRHCVLEPPMTEEEFVSDLQPIGRPSAPVVHKRRYGDTQSHQGSRQPSDPDDVTERVSTWNVGESTEEVSDDDEDGKPPRRRRVSEEEEE